MTRARPRPPLTPAQSVLAARHAALAARVARRLRPWDEDEAESEAMLVLTEAARDWPADGDPAAFAGWLKARLRLRLRPATDRGSVAAQAAGDLAERVADGAVDVPHADAIPALPGRLEALPSAWRRVIRLRYGLSRENGRGHPHSVAAVAKVLGRSSRWVARVEREALARLADDLDREGKGS